MISRFVEGQSFQSATAGSVATMQISNDGSRLRSILLSLNVDSGDPLDHPWDYISEIRLNVGGKTVRRYTGTSLETIVNFNGPVFDGDAVSGKHYIRIPFAEPWRRTAIEQDALAWGTSTPRNGVIQLEVVLTGDYKGGLKAVLEVDDVRGPNGEVIPLGEIMKVERHQLPFNTAGKATWNTIPRRGKLHRMHFMSNKVEKVEITIDGLKVFEMTKAEADEFYKGEGFSPSVNAFHVVFDHAQRINQFIDLHNVGDFRVDLTLASGVTAFPVITEFREIVT